MQNGLAEILHLIAAVDRMPILHKENSFIAQSSG
jgi:hypothetical protein